jgi:hypothetical protein
MLNIKIFFCQLAFLCLCFCNTGVAQQQKDTIIIKTQDSTANKNILSLDTTAKKNNPKMATFRSAVLPGWGQAYNKKYWKIPIIYGALGTTAFIFTYNLKTYKLLRRAVALRSDTIPTNDIEVDPQFRNLSTETIRSFRSSFRQNVDYSVLFFILFWGLNVVDATVDAHLKSFDVSDNISLRIKPKYNPGTKIPGLSFVFAFKEKHPKALSSLR